MANIIIVVIIAILVILMLRSSLKHFKGEGGCCGSSGVIEDNKKLKDPEIACKTFLIQGMTCNNCKIKVKNAINRIEGISADVNLQKGIAKVHYSKNISDQQIRQVVEDAGYHIV